MLHQDRNSFEIVEKKITNWSRHASFKGRPINFDEAYPRTSYANLWWMAGTIIKSSTAATTLHGNFELTEELSRKDVI